MRQPPLRRRRILRLHPHRTALTGKQRDAETGNDYFGARYYASTMGRFLSPDWSAKVEPVPYAKLGDPQSLNLYDYMLDNPLGGVDADGHNAKCKGTICTTGINNFKRLQGKQQAQQQKPSLFQKLVGAIHSWAVANGHTALAGVLTRYMGTGEAATALKTGKIPNVGRDLTPRPTHLTPDKPMRDPVEVQKRYSLPEQPTHRATVPDERVPNARVPEAGPTTEGGGSQVVTDDEIQVDPGEITGLDIF